MPADAPNTHPEPQGPGDYDLTAALAEAAEQFQAEPAPMIAAGLTRGRRIRRRRAAALAAGVTAVVLAAAGGTLALLPGGGLETVVTSPAGAGSSPGVPKLGYTDKQLIHALETALPTGRFSAPGAQVDPRSANSQAEVVFDDGAGAARFLLTVGRTSLDLGSELNCAELSADSCVITSRPDGSRVQEWTAHGSQLMGGGGDTVKLRQISLEYPDGREIGLMELNAPNQNGPSTRTDPPLSFDQLIAAVQNQKAWAPIWAGTPLPDFPSVPPQERAFAWQQLDGTLESLLPAGLHISNAGGRTEEVELFADDGHGAGLVQLKIMPQQMLHTKGGTTTVQPDGTKLILDPDAKTDDPNAVKTVRAMSATLLRSDGTAIVVTAFNSAGFDVAPNRQAPVLTLDQLKAIVLSSKWPTRQHQ
jgi:hypothetical protein